MQTEIVVRFDYGAIVPWVSQQEDGRLQFVAGPDKVLFDTTVQTRGEDLRTVGDFALREGEEASFVLNWSPSFRKAPPPLSGEELVEARKQVHSFWTGWAAAFKPAEDWGDAVLRSLLTLKALAHWETGGIVAAATTSLPEQLGGPRNWDYRFCWLRDATFTLYALIGAGFLDEAKAWHEWLLRAVAGGPDDLQIVYGVAGERRLEEFEIPGCRATKARLRSESATGRSDNSNSMSMAKCSTPSTSRAAQAFPPASRPGRWNARSISHLETIWREPDEGIWEVRGGRAPFHAFEGDGLGRVRSRGALNRGIRARWAARALAGCPAAIHEEVCERGMTPSKTRSSNLSAMTTLDASLLLIPIVGFLPPDDPRVQGTVAAIERELLRDGFVLRYDTGTGVDGLPPGEGAFLACSFWLVDNYVLLGRYDEAHALFERLLALRNDVGLAGGAIRSSQPPSARQLPSGVFASRAHQFGA